MKDYKIFGIAGTMASGKDTIATYLVREHNFMFVSVSELLRDEVRARGGRPDRESLRNLSAEWRREHGYGVLVDKAVAAYEKSDAAHAGLVIASIRHTSETERIHELGGYQIWIDADPHLRYERVQTNNRGRPHEDDRTFEQFIADEKTESSHEGDAATLNMQSIEPLADVRLYNETNDVPGFEKSAFKALKQYL